MSCFFLNIPIKTFVNINETKWRVFWGFAFNNTQTCKSITLGIDPAYFISHKLFFSKEYFKLLTGLSKKKYTTFSSTPTTTHYFQLTERHKINRTL